jgi:hypothetical protein
MDATSYCNTVVDELTTWKGKLDSVILKLDKNPGEVRDKISPQVNEIRLMVTEIEDRIDTLRTECPKDWVSEKKVLDTKLGKVRAKWEVLSMLPPGRRLEKTNF